MTVQEPSPTTSSYYALAKTAAVKAFQEHMSILLENDAVKEKTMVYTWLVDLRRNQRIYFMNQNMAVGFWDTIRGNDVLLDFVMRGTQLFMLYLSESIRADNGGTLQAYVRRLALSIGTLVSNDREPVADKTYLEKKPKTETVEPLLMREPWLVFILTLETTLSELLPKPVMARLTTGGDVNETRSG